MARKLTNRTPIKSEAELRADKQAQFIGLLSQTCNVTLSAKGTGISRVTAYEWRDTYPAFARAWEDALQQAIELLEAEAWQRARKQSDTLMIFLLKAHKPEKYRDQYTVRIDDWRTQAIADIRAGTITYEALVKAFDIDLATELFTTAGVPIQISES